MRLLSWGPVTRGTTRALGVLGTMYVAQGIVWGFASFVLLPTLAARGVSIEGQTGIVALAGVPWVLKLAWGPVIDAFGGVGRGRARRFASVGLLGMGASLLGMATLDDPGASVDRVAILWLLLNVALSLQDVATDAMALDGIAAERRGLANGVMLGGHHIGLEGVGGLVLGAVVASQGMSVALAAQGALALGLSLVPAAMPGPPHERHERASSARGSLVSALVSMAAERKLGIAVLAAIVLFADVLTGALSSEFWVNRLGWSALEVSERLPPVLLGANLVGFFGAAALADRIGHRRTAAGGTIALGLAWVAFAALQPAWGDEHVILAFVVVQALATAPLYVGLHALLMDATIPSVRATHFAVLTTLLNLPRAVAPTLAPALLSALGWGGLFVACGAFQVALAWPIARLGRPPHDPA